MSHERLLLRGLDEGRQRAFCVVAVLLLGLDVDAVELEGPLRDPLTSEAVVDQRGAVRTPRDLELEAEPEAAEPFLERRPAEGAEHAGGADGRRQREMLLRIGLGDAQATQEV